MTINVEDIEILQQKIQHRIPLDVLEDYSDRIEDLIQRGEHLKDDRNLERHVSTYLSEQIDLRLEGDRGEPLCSCRLPTCSIKRGVVPAPIRVRGSGLLIERDIRKRASEWCLDHPGDAAAVTEALESYDKEIGKLHTGWLTLYRELTAEDKTREIAGRLGRAEGDA